MRIFRPVIKATNTVALKNKGERPHLLFSKVSINDGRYLAETTGDQNSSNLAIMLQANGIIEIAPGEAINPGTEINVTLINRVFEMRHLCQ